MPTGLNYAASTSAAPKSAQPKRTVRRKKQQAPLPDSGCQQGRFSTPSNIALPTTVLTFLTIEVTADDIDHATQETWVNINSQRAALGMPVMNTGPQDSFTGHNDSMPQYGYNGSGHSGQGSFGIHGGFTPTSTPGGQSYAGPAPMPAAQYNPGPVHNAGQPYLNTTTPTWPNQQGFFGGFGQPHPTVATAWTTQGRFQQGTAVPTSTSSSISNFLGPELLAVYNSSLASENPEPSPLPNCQQQYQVNPFTPMPNRSATGPLHPPGSTSSVNPAELTRSCGNGTGNGDWQGGANFGDWMSSHQQQPSPQESIGLAAYDSDMSEGSETPDFDEFLSLSPQPESNDAGDSFAVENAQGQAQAMEAVIEMPDWFADPGLVFEHEGNAQDYGVVSAGQQMQGDDDLFGDRFFMTTSEQLEVIDEHEGNAQDGGIMGAGQQMEEDNDLFADATLTASEQAGDEQGQSLAQNMPLATDQQPQQRQSSEERLIEALTAALAENEAASKEQEKHEAPDHGGEAPLYPLEELCFGVYQYR